MCVPPPVSRPPLCGVMFFSRAPRPLRSGSVKRVRDSVPLTWADAAHGYAVTTQETPVLLFDPVVLASPRL
jgi:hypothetical protein